MKAYEAEATFRWLQQELEYYNNIMLTLSWDMRVNLPPKAAEYRGGTMGFLAEKIYQLRTSPEMKAAAEAVLSSGEADDILSAAARRALSEYEKYTKIPRKLIADFSAYNLKAELVWQEARKKSDFSMFRDSMQGEFAYKRQFAEVFGQGGDVMTYLMDEWEPGLTRERMDALFAQMKEFLIPFVRRIRESGIKINKDALCGFSYPVDKQRELCREVLSAIGYDFDAGLLSESAHPYTTANDRRDIRITTRYFENDFLPALISCCHEGGHALYRQNLDPALDGLNICTSSSMGMDEGQSRFIENIIARRRSFWQWLRPIAVEKFPELERFSAEDMYRMVNGVFITPVRLQCDELTYSLHVIIRYELEKMLFDGEITVDEAPRVWSDKYEEYLGVRPKDDAEGILQDMHYASGYIGYFQCYVMGNFYDGCLLKRLKVDVPDMDGQIARGEFKNVVAWLTKNVYRYGARYSSGEVLRMATGEELSAQPYIDYLREKYSDIYGL